ncbi:RNA methylase, partial [Perkinsus olseni]
TSLANHIERLKSDIVGLQHELAKARNENVALHLKYSKLQSTDSRGEIARLQDEVEKLTGDLRAVREASLAGFTMGRRPQEKFGGDGSVEYFADPSKSLLAVNSTAVAGATSADPTLAHLQTATTLLQAQVSEAYRMSTELRGISGKSENFYRPTVTTGDGVEGGTLNSVHGERWGVDKHLMATDIYGGVFPADAYRYNYNYFPSPEAPKEAADGGGKGLNVMFAGGKNERRASNFKSGGEFSSNRSHRQAIVASSGSAAGRFNSTKTSGSRKGSRQGSVVVGGDGRKQSLASKYLSDRKSYVSSRGYDGPFDVTNFYTVLRKEMFGFGMEIDQEKICLNLMLASAEEVDLSESISEKICDELGELDWEEIGSKVRLAMGVEIDHVIDFKVETQRKGKRFSGVSSFDITRAVAEKVSFISGGRWRGRVNPKPAVVIRIFINDDWIIVDVPVMGRIDRSGGRKCVGLASPVAWAMNKQARSTMDFMGLKDTRDLIILDPFCGTGATIFERSEAKRWGIGIDSEKNFRLRKLMSNSAYLSEVDVDGILGDGRRLCMRKDTFDVIISDLPFGVQWCSEDTQKLEDLYRLALPEFGRLCRDSGVMVLLTKESLVDLVMESLSSSWTVVHIRKVKLGEMPSAIVTIVSRKNAEKFPKFSGAKQRFDWESIQGRSEWAALKCNLRPPLEPIGYL